MHQWSDWCNPLSLWVDYRGWMLKQKAQWQGSLDCYFPMISLCATGWLAVWLAAVIKHPSIHRPNHISGVLGRHPTSDRLQKNRHRQILLVPDRLVIPFPIMHNNYIANLVRPHFTGWSTIKFQIIMLAQFQRFSIGQIGDREEEQQIPFIEVSFSPPLRTTEAEWGLSCKFLHLNN